ncbi:hypothetical protein CONPUDRAFT_141397 [Coniophora puteana RWD-64-598 SS2]|uniref:Uncharacterized protein n=1 Tax=Coniophora puteana (strain RWD-64-598) TaxID=741705 RepID=A0A5M3N7L6_CONPW|nr:uncharacterized protein CONPUDRAFT_141397 [Coniophora puteana RWD-64-598 SS2]EIW87157.1 hypothetical protein CONPUDRAFT_141397 [Coniophora puteana RWD-64-598 SS2]
MSSGAKAADLLTLIVECVLYGFCVSLFVAAASVQLSGLFAGRIKQLIGGASVLLFMLSTAHVMTQILTVYQGEITVPAEQQETFAMDDTADIYTTIKDICYLIESVLGDSILIYRCYRMWNTLWVVIPFAITDCASAALTIVTIINASRSVGSDFMAGSDERWNLASFTMVLVTDLVPTCLLSYKLWIARRTSIDHKQRHRLSSLARVILECGVIYSLCLIAFMIVTTMQNYASYVAVGMSLPDFEHRRTGDQVRLSDRGNLFFFFFFFF